MHGYFGKALLFFSLIMCMFSSVHAQVQYIRQKPENTQVIVFVHGVIGDSVGTWTNSATKAYWPAMLNSDPTFSHANIAVLNLVSPKMAHAPTIDELADSMRLSLDTKDVLTHRQIIFIAHSMGGLVTRAFLAKYRENIRKVGFIYFFATPTTGSSVASIGRLVSRNPQFGKLMPMTSDGYLADLQRTWLADKALSSIPSFCAYEIQPTAGVKIVEQQSATNLCNNRLDPINADHAGIVKPANKEDTPYVAFKSAYRTFGLAEATSLRVENQNTTQVLAALSENPHFNGEPIICGAAKSTLIFAHNRAGSAPIRIQSIAVKTRELNASTGKPSGKCEVDPMSSKPYGIAETETVVVTTTDSGVRTKFLKNATTAYPVNPENILESKEKTRAITLKNGEEPFAFKVILEERANQPYQIWFEVTYDEDGVHKITTSPITIWR